MAIYLLTVSIQKQRLSGRKHCMDSVHGQALCPDCKQGLVFTRMGAVQGGR